MKKILAVLFLMLIWNSSQCQCFFSVNDTIVANADFYVQANVGGLVNNDLASNQSLCGVQLHFRHEFIGNLQIELISPAGQKILLVGPTVLGNFTSGTVWDITFLRCGDAVIPDNTFPSKYDNIAPWVIGATYTGSYYPNFGCLEDFNVGTANGIWQLHIVNAPFYTGNLIDFSLIFCDPTGQECSPCDAAVGQYINKHYTFCQNDTALNNFQIPIDYSQNPPDNLLYNYDFVLTNNGNIINIANMINYGLLAPGSYDVYLLSYLKSYQPLVLTYVGLPFQALKGKVSSTTICGDLSVDSARVDIHKYYNLPTKEIILCSGDSLIVSGKKYVSSGFIRDTLKTIWGCDSIVNIDLKFTNIQVALHADTIDCINFSAKIDTSDFRMEVPNGVILNYEWLDGSGQILSNNGSIVVNSPGIYYLHIIILYGNLQCEYKISKKVESQVYPPEMPLLKSFSPCALFQTKIVLQPDTLRDIAHFSIEGNYTSQLVKDSLFITWKQPGTYKVCVWATNECGTSDTLCQQVVVGDKPIFSMDFDTVTCNGAFQIQVMGSGISLSWADPKGGSNYTILNNGTDVNGFIKPNVDSIKLVYSGLIEGCDVSGQISLLQKRLPEYSISDTAFCGSGLYRIPILVKNHSGELFYQVDGIGYTAIVMPGVNYLDIPCNMTTLVLLDSMNTRFTTCSQLNNDTSIIRIENQPISILQDTLIVCNTFGSFGPPIYYLPDIITSGETSGSWNFSNIPGIKVVNDSINLSQVAVGVYTVNFKTNTAIAPCVDQSYFTVFKVEDCTCDPPALNTLVDDYLYCNNYGWLNLDSLSSVSESVSWYDVTSGNKVQLSGNGINLGQNISGDLVIMLQTSADWQGACADTAIINIKVEASQYAGDDYIMNVCEGTNIEVDLDTLLKNGRNDGVWIPGKVENVSFYSAFEPTSHKLSIGKLKVGTYIVYKIVPATQACPGDTAVLYITIHSNPVLKVEGLGYLDCISQDCQITLKDSNQNSTTTQWLFNNSIIYTSNGSDSIKVDQPGVYTFIATDDVTGCKDTTHYQILDNSNPIDTVIYSILPDCSTGGSILVLDIPAGGTPPYEYSMDGGAPTTYLQFYNIDFGLHSLVVRDAKNCMYQISFDVDSADIFSLTLGGDTTLRLGEKIWFDIPFPKANIQEMEVFMNGKNYYYQGKGEWLIPEGTIKIDVIIKDKYGCIYTASRLIYIENKEKIFVPNIFSPNGDGNNDKFFIPYSPVIKSILELNVYDRWGNHLYGAKNFDSGDETIGWDGNFHGQKMNPGVFVYYIKYITLDGKEVTDKGSFTLLR